MPTKKHSFIGRDSEYKHLGTVSFLAGMDHMTGEIISLVRDTHKNSDFIDFLKILDDKYDKVKWIKLVLDNHSAHTSKETRMCFKATLGRFEIVFTPQTRFMAQYDRKLLWQVCPCVPERHSRKNKRLIGSTNLSVYERNKR